MLNEGFQINKNLFKLSHAPIDNSLKNFKGLMMNKENLESNKVNDSSFASSEKDQKNQEIFGDLSFKNEKLIESFDKNL